MYDNRIAIRWQHCKRDFSADFHADIAEAGFLQVNRKFEHTLEQGNIRRMCFIHV